ncbi:uncharacterized protein Z518_03598 [Rhinocladiella mackenziei CBS 650.93]|uniref:Uncharacterized protein n=1 Tax=Rhinocladiella mackenziei CBS 650.93 TaxID=1442369 RepID=A0A0D2IR37_9EURO|nr:uncharacterized protein Z518_03598 [Rhinocladiella mackenziei CBS 650.93]KIX05626.1 hypothetical protein Z518_03598 [Rhinocladiella mackenziei CBS 650.93]
MTARFKAPGIDPYVGTYVLIFDFNESQTEITKFIEFIDTGTTQEIVKKVNEGRARLGWGPLEAP